jgi:hypothetical protein
VLKGFKAFAMRGQYRGLGGRRDYRCSLRKGCVLAGGGPGYAADRSAARSREFFRIIHQSERQILRNAGSRKGGERADPELWGLSELGDQLSDRGVCRIPDRP